MYKQLLFLLFSLFLLLSVSSCKEDEDKATITAIRLENTAISLFPGEEFQLEVIHSPADVPAPKYSWYEGKPNTASAGAVATVDQSGLVKAWIVEGSTTVTVFTPDHHGKDGEYLSATCFVTVNTTKATAIAFNQDKYELAEGENLTIGLTAETNNPKLPVYEITNLESFKWEIENPQIATVENGVVTAISLGETTLTVIDDYSNLRASCTLVVTTVEIESVAFDEDAIEIEYGTSATLHLNILPANASRIEWIWSTSDEEMITVDENGSIEAIGVGTATVKVTSMDGKHSAEIKVISLPVSVTGIKAHIPYDSPVQIRMGYRLVATVYPTNANNRNYTWEVVEGNATIDENEIFRAYEKGDVTICAVSEDGGHRDYQTITVAGIDELTNIHFVTRNLFQNANMTTFIFNSKITLPRGATVNMNLIYILDDKGNIREIPTPSYNLEENSFVVITQPYTHIGSINWSNHPFKGWQIFYLFTANGIGYSMIEDLNTNSQKEF